MPQTKDVGRSSPKLWALVWMLALWGLGSPLFGQAPLTVKEARWGFDGTIREFTFLPASVLLQNTSSGIVKTRIRFGRCDLPPEFRGDVYEQEVTLAGNSSRWVQFIPEVFSGAEQWQIQYGPDPQDFFPMPPARSGKIVAVLLDSPEGRFHPTSLDRFPSDLFPGSIVGTDLLDIVFLDHQPQLEGARLQAFLEWLRAGGSVVLLQQDDGKFPTFLGELAALNDPASVIRFGQGVIRRRPVRARDVTTDEIRELTAVPDLSPRIASNTPQPAGTVVPKSGFLFESVMESLAHFNRPWWLIYPFTIVYLAVIGPLAFWVSRSSPMRGFYTLFLGTVVAACVLIVVLNRSSIGSTPRLRTVAIAHEVEGNLWNIRQWTGLATIQSGEYQLVPRADSGTFATPIHDSNPVISSGRLTMRRPTMSTVMLQHRARLKTSEEWIEVVSAPGAAGTSAILGDVAVQLHGPLSGLPKKTVTGFIARGNTLYELEARDDQLVAKGAVLNLDTLFQFNWNYYQYAYHRVDDWFFAPLEKEVFQSLVHPLVRFELTSPMTGLIALPPDRIRVMVLAPMPDQFRFQGEGIDQAGWVMFVLDR
jgi:hypothetical protein